jgi:hypothetical protein
MGVPATGTAAFMGVATTITTAIMATTITTAIMGVPTTTAVPGLDDTRAEAITIAAAGTCPWTQRTTR